MIRSPLRYPGGKQKGISSISQYLPPSFNEFREPFMGGGSVFFHVLQTYPSMKYWVNDLNEELYHFWFQVKTNLPVLAGQPHTILNN